MTAKTAAKRQAEKRERDRMKEEERLARLLSRRISLDLYKSTNMALIRTMARLGIDEPQDVLTRLVHGADRLDDESLAELTSY
ncbi:MAG: hypothetical protein AB7E55_07740 [Pigmentiphaga sp.]